MSGKSIHLLEKQKKKKKKKKKKKRRHVQEINVEGGIIFSDLSLSPPFFSNTCVIFETVCQINESSITLFLLWKRGGGVTKFR